MNASGTSQAEPLVELSGIRKSFGARQVLGGVDLAVARGEVVVVLGPSGSGKTTLLRCANFLERPDAGRVRIGDLAVDAATATRGQVLALRQRSAMVFQNYNLFRNKTALGNVTEALVVVKRLPRSEADERGLALLARMGLTEKRDAYPAQLSGGQQQRVGIARALALNPGVILFDEPTSSLDPELVGDVLATIKQVAADGITMIVVTHEMGFAREVADRVVFIDAGAIVEEGPPDAVFDRPRHERTRQFLSRIARA